MRVISKLAQIDFRFGHVERQGNLLAIESHPDSKMKSTVYVSPQDVVEYLKRLLVNPTAILFFLGLPYFLYRWHRSGSDAGPQGKRRKKAWPSV